MYKELISGILVVGLLIVLAGAAVCAIAWRL